jgi:hypothetical protein
MRLSTDLIAISENHVFHGPVSALFAGAAHLVDVAAGHDFALDSPFFSFTMA